MYEREYVLTMDPTLRSFSRFPFKVFLPFGGLGSGGVIYIGPVKPFETVPVFKGYGNMN